MEIYNNYYEQSKSILLSINVDTISILWNFFPFTRLALRFLMLASCEHNPLNVIVSYRFQTPFEQGLNLTFAYNWVRYRSAFSDNSSNRIFIPAIRNK